VRASLGLYERSQANALINNRKDVNFEDIKDAIISVLGHRIRLKPSIKYLQSPVDYIKKKFDKEIVEENWEEELKKGGFL